MYTLSSSPYTIHASPFFHTAVVRDHHSWEDFDETDVDTYFSDAHQRFITRIMELQSPSRTLSKSEEKELWFMFESLLHAKRLL